MSKIKYINCFGTSYTAGGGFEFDGDKNPLNNLYSGLETPLTQFNFSYPGQLKKVLDENVKVTNYAKNGYGNDRTFRKIYELVNDKNFNKDEHIFIIEYAGLGRREFWFNPINDYIVSNYWFNFDTLKLKDMVYLANSYGYETRKMSNDLKKYEPLFLEFFKQTLNLKNEIKLNEQNIEFFSSYLNQHKLNYFYTTDIFDSNSGKNFIFGDVEYFKQSNDFLRFSEYNNLSIKSETFGIDKDLHNGYISNKIVGLTIYNKLVELELIDSNKIDIDWKELKNFKLKTML